MSDLPPAAAPTPSPSAGWPPRFWVPALVALGLVVLALQLAF